MSKERKARAAFLVAVLVLSGCVNVSPAVLAGSGRYVVSAVSHAQWLDAAPAAVQEASRICEIKGLQADVEQLSSTGTDFAASSRATLLFSCTR